MLTGWVAESALMPSPPRMLGLTGAGAGTLAFGESYRMKSPIEWLSCDRELDLYGEVGGERGVVGRVSPAIRFEAGRHRDGWVDVDFWASWIVPSEGVFLLREGDLAGCHRTAPEQAALWRAPTWPSSSP